MRFRRLEDLHALTDGLDNGALGRLEGPLQVRRPLKLTAWAEKRLEWGHRVTQLGVVSHLVDQAEPAPDIRRGDRGGKISDGIQVIRERLDGSVRHPEAGKLHPLFRELELIRVQHDA